MISLNKLAVSNIKGVGPKKEQLLNNLNIYSIKDLLEYIPRDYQNLKDISSLDQITDEKSLYKLEVISQPIVSRVRGNMTLLKFRVSDGSSVGEVVYFNQDFLKNKFHLGRSYYFLGQVKRSRFGLQLQSPELISTKDIGRFKPIYNLTKGLTNNELTRFIISAFNNYKDYIIDYLPDDFKRKYKLMDLRRAIRGIHYPESKEQIKFSRYRLAFDELFILQIAMDNFVGNSEDNLGPNFDLEKYMGQIREFIAGLDFDLTTAQKRVVKEILEDMDSSRQMNRLLQGDVGSGKTIVSAIAIYFSYLNGFQSAFMAPTEILAVQQYESFKESFKDQGINIGFLTSSVLGEDRDKIYKGIKESSIDLLVGTHALIQDELEFEKLGLTVTDEQHRFGVKQRQDLTRKGKFPHNLVMTATPIPRTLAHVLYGSMDISILDELPANRKEIQTVVIDDSYISRLDNFILEEIHQGRQVYVVCPLIESDDKKNIELRSLEEVYRHYKSDKFSSINVAYVHGHMANEEKNEIMTKFLNNEIQLLVSTTVIEVGINVANASLMVIYDADRFGLSQLHQLRGRVGRGDQQSYCVLINNNMSDKAFERMQIMKQSSNGFYIAEKDLELRGEGDLLGYRQHGLANLKIADIVSDSQIVEFINQVKDPLLDQINKYPNKSKEFKELVENKQASIDL